MAAREVQLLFNNLTFRFAESLFPQLEERALRRRSQIQYAIIHYLQHDVWLHLLSQTIYDHA